MVLKVIKKDGREEPFEIEKIKKAIRGACEEAGIEETKKEELADLISEKIVEMYDSQETVRAIELRDKILGELEMMAPEAAAAWRNYEASKGK
jgi:transcriptional regulator NrdR family protein